MSRTTRKLPPTVRKQTKEEVIAEWGDFPTHCPRMIRFNHRLGRDGGYASDVREPYKRGRGGLGWDGASGPNLKRSWKRQVGRYVRRSMAALTMRELLKWEAGE